MAIIVTRAGKGSPLTNAEVDANFTNLNNQLATALFGANNLSDLADVATARSNLGLANVENKSSATIRGELTSLNVTAALGFTPASEGGSYANPSWITSLAASKLTGTVATALLGTGTADSTTYLRGDGTWATIVGGVSSFNTRSGAITLSSSDVTTALGFTPYNSTNPSGYITSSASITGSAGSVSGLTLTSSANGIDPNSVTQNQIGYNTSVSLFGQTDGGLYSSAYSSAWIHQIYGDFRTGQIAIRGKNNGSWQSWRTVLDSSNYAGYSAFTGAVGGDRHYSGYDSGVSGSMSVNNWFRTSGACGLYYASYGRGIQASDVNSSYGNNQPYGSGLNGWQGWAVGTNNDCILMTNGATHGFYNPVGGVWQAQWDDSGNVTWNGNVTAYSDLRLKQNVREIDNVIERRNTLAMAAIKYERDGRTRVGYGAQTLLHNGCPEFVIEADDSLKMVTGLGTLSVDYGETTAVLAVASKITDDRVAALEQKVAELTALLISRDKA